MARWLGAGVGSIGSGTSWAVTHYERMRFELWEGVDENRVWESSLIADGDVKSRAELVDTPRVEHTWTAEAETRDETMQLYRDHMGWASTGPSMND